MTDSWPATTETSSETYESDYGNTCEVEQVTWPAAPIFIELEPPEPPGGYG
jgi:hypothetical protein